MKAERSRLETSHCWSRAPAVSRGGTVLRVALVCAALLTTLVPAVGLIDTELHLRGSLGSTDAEPTSFRTGEGRLQLTGKQVEDAARSGLWPGEVRSILQVEQPLKHGGFVWNEAGAPDGRLSIKVDLRRQLISAFRDGHEIGTAVILYGADSHNTPQGRYQILEKVRDYHSRTYDAPMPYTLRLTSDGVAIHASNVERGSATHGCIGVPLEFARRLFEASKSGDEVLIVS